MIKGYFLVWVTTRAAIEKNKDISLEDWQCGFPLRLKNKYYHFTSKYHLRWSTIAFDCESANFDAINCERRQSMQLNRECIASNYDVFWFLFYFLIRIPDCLVRYCVTSQYPVYEKVISYWSPWHWNHGRSCFVGSVDIFWWPTRSCKEIHLVSWMTSYPTRNLSHWSIGHWSINWLLHLVTKTIGVYWHVSSLLCCERCAFDWSSCTQLCYSGPICSKNG